MKAGLHRQIKAEWSLGRPGTQNPVRGRVLSVTSSFPRWTGDSTSPFVLRLAQDLTQLGWSVDVLAPHAPGLRAGERLEGIPVSRFRYFWPSRLETLCYAGGALINLRKHPIERLKIPQFLIAQLLAVKRRLLTGRYDLLHSHWILPQGFTGVLATKLSGIPHVVTVHGGDIFALQGRVLHILKRFTLHQADAVTVNSSATKNAVMEIASRVRDLRYIPMGVTIDGPAREEGVGEIRLHHRRGGGPLVLFVGRVVEEKGVEDLLRATNLLVPSMPDISVLIVGDGQDRIPMQEVAWSLGLSDRVHFVGAVSPDKVAAYMAAADIVVAPSRRAPDGWVEAQGLTLIEAMLSGAPVVTTRMGGVIDVISDGETGLLVPERSPSAIADAISVLVHDDELRERLRILGRQTAEAKFSRIGAATEFSRLFHQLVVGRRK
jgi:phosphatidylinositol alpha-1,6-mannosyltransferase